MAIRLTTLGTARVHGGESGYPDLPSQRLRFALLVYLAVERDVSREEVLSMFWPDRDTARGKHALRQMLYELKQVLGEDWIDVGRDRLTSSVVVDATEFETAASDGRADDALRLYGGAFLAGFPFENRSFEGWADRRRAHLARVHRKLRRERIASLASAGKTEAALAEARRWVELDPLEDEAAHTLIERLVAAGQRTVALKYYEAYERQLAAELQVEPLDETKVLVAAIRSGDAVQAAPLVAPRVEPESARVEPESATPQPAIPQSATSPPVPPQHAAQTDADSAQQSTRARFSLWHGVSVLRRVALVAVVFVGLVAIALNIEPAVDAPVVADRPVQIAVLPFADHSTDASLVALANELTETLAHSLAQSRLLNIIPPNGVLLLRSQGTPEDSLGRLLGADFLVGGSVSTAGDRIRVAVELLDGRTGGVVVSEAVDRPLRESRIVLDDVVRETTTFLRLHVSSHVEIARVRALTTSEDAWRHYLEAKMLRSGVADLIRRGDFLAAQLMLERADSLLALAANLDRRWAEPIVARGWIRDTRAFTRMMTSTGEPMTRHDLLVDALRMADLAEERDPLNPGVYALRGAMLRQLALLPGTPISMVPDRFEEAEVALRRAVELDPRNQGSWRLLGDILSSMGRYGEAKFAAERGYRLDPYSVETSSLIHVLFGATFELGEDDQAESWCLEGRRRFTTDPRYLYCLLALHAWADGIDPDLALLHRAIDSFGTQRLQPELPQRFVTMIAAAHARSGQPDSARAILAEVDYAKDRAQLWMSAAAHVILGEEMAAIALLDTYLADAESYAALHTVRSRPFSRLRGNPDYERVINEAGSLNRERLNGAELRAR